MRIRMWWFPLSISRVLLFSNYFFIGFVSASAYDEPTRHHSAAAEAERCSVLQCCGSVAVIRVPSSSRPSIVCLFWGSLSWINETTAHTQDDSFGIGNTDIECVRRFLIYLKCSFCWWEATCRCRPGKTEINLFSCVNALSDLISCYYVNLISDFRCRIRSSINICCQKHQVGLTVFGNCFFLRAVRCQGFAFRWKPMCVAIWLAMFRRCYLYCCSGKCLEKWCRKIANSTYPNVAGTVLTVATHIPSKFNFVRNTAK